MHSSLRNWVNIILYETNIPQKTAVSLKAIISKKKNQSATGESPIVYMMIKFFRSVSYVNTFDSYSGILTFMASQLKYMVKLCNSWVNNDILLLENWTQYSPRCYMCNNKTLRRLSVVNMIWCTHFCQGKNPSPE